LRERVKVSFTVAIALRRKKIKRPEEASLEGKGHPLRRSSRRRKEWERKGELLRRLPKKEKLRSAEGERPGT